MSGWWNRFNADIELIGQQHPALIIPMMMFYIFVGASVLRFLLPALFYMLAWPFALLINWKERRASRKYERGDGG